MVVYSGHLGARQATHHQLLVFQPIVFVVIVSGSFRSAQGLETSEWSPVGLRVEGVDHDGLRAFDLAAAERAALTFWLLAAKRGSVRNTSEPQPGPASQQQSRHCLPATPSGRTCTSGACRARSSHLCHSRHRSYTAGRWIPSHSTTRTAPVEEEEEEKHAGVIHNRLSLWAPQRSRVGGGGGGRGRTNLSDFNVILRRWFTQSSQIWILGATIRKQITATHTHTWAMAVSVVF